MGLFDKAKKAAMEMAGDVLPKKMRGKAAPKAVNPLFNVRMWNVPPCKGIAKLRRVTTGKVYVYTPELLAGLHVGQEFVLEAFPGDCTIRSSYNGTEIDTRRDETLAWCYKGNVIGASRWSMEDATRLMREGYRVIADAQMTGWYDVGVPEICIWVARGKDCYDVVGR